jgi:Protein of unknown function (DUF4242)
MEQYLVELYRSRAGADTLADPAKRAQTTAEELTREGTPVRFLSTIFVPEDEVCFYLYEAASAEAAAEAARRAELQFERIVVAITETPRLEIRR